MSDEEKKDLLKKLQYCELEYQQDGYLSVGKFKAIKQAIEVIEKQSKEIEELKAINSMQKYRIEVIDERELISKDEIKAIIEEVQKDLENSKDAIEANIILGKKLILQSLLEKE